jgi:hypothetical protein
MLCVTPDQVPTSELELLLVFVICNRFWGFLAQFYEVFEMSDGIFEMFPALQQIL